MLLCALSLIILFILSASYFTLSICTLLFFCPEVFLRIQHKCQHLAFIRKQAPAFCSSDSQQIVLMVASSGQAPTVYVDYMNVE